MNLNLLLLFKLRYLYPYDLTHVCISYSLLNTYLCNFKIIAIFVIFTFESIIVNFFNFFPYNYN